MSVKRKLTTIRLDKIAGVDRPCQVHATMAIVKRAPTSAAPAIAKATFEEALRGQLVGEKVNEVFWRAFDKQWAVREAFAEAMTDELADGGDGSTATEGFLSAMRTIAETAVTLAREASADPTNQNLESAVEQAVEKWLNQQETSAMKITTKAALKAAVAAFDPAVTTVATVGIIKQAAKDLSAEDELPAEGPLALDVTQDDPALAKVQRELAELKLPADVRKHYDGLADDDAKTAFLAKSADDQAADVTAANSTDPVLYKTATGIEIRKSDGSAALQLAKQADRDRAELVKLRDGTSADQLDKRATSEFPNVAKAVAVDMLKSAATVGVDTDAGKAVIKSLKAMNDGGGKLFKSLGSTEVSEAGAAGMSKALSDFNGKVGDIAKRDGIGPADAMSKARVEFPELFAEAYPDAVEAED